MSSNTITFDQEALDRQTCLTFADGRSRQWTFDRDSNITRYTDENGSVSDRTYDALNRQKDDTITRAAGVIGTTLQTFQYDGAGRNTRATDNGDPADPAQSSVQTFVFDSLGRQLEESLQIGSTGTVRYTTGSKWSSDSDRTELTYPNGRQVQATFDKLGRLKTLKDAGAATPIATWRWMGSRVLEMAYASGICLTHLNNARTASAYQPGMPAGELRGFDGLGRIVAHRWLQCTLDANGFPTGYVNPGTPLIGFRHAWNAADNKLSQELMHGTDKSEAYKYDSASRLIQFDRGTLNAALTDVVTPTPIAGLLQKQEWTLDGPGNWPVNKTTTDGVTTTENRTHNNLNQITAIDAVPLTYDSNGNTTDDRDFLHAYDAKNRLRRVTRKSDNVVVGIYSYDAVGRRIRRVYVAPGTPTPPAVTVHYYLDQQRVIEEREVEGTAPAELLKRQYTYGPYIDECLTLDRDLNGNAIATDPGERLFYHANTLYSVYALSDSSRNQPERYLYDAYGRPIVWLPGPDAIYGTGDDTYTLDSPSSVQNVRLFTGREWDGEARSHFFRSRYHSVRLGRFFSRDSFAFFDGANLYVYVANNPVDFNDPTGLQIIGLALQYCKCCIEAWLVCRPLEGPLGRPPWIGGVGPRPLRHCFVYWVDHCAKGGKGESYTYSLFPVGKPPGWQGVPSPNDPTDHPWPAGKPRTGWPANSTFKKCKGCVTKECLDDASKNYPIGNYDLPGPNSNTFAFTVFSQCCTGGTTPWSPPWTGTAPGWDDKPPKPTKK